MILGRAPAFWWRPAGWQARALSPLSSLYGAVARRNMEHAPRVPTGLPVLCVGNFTVGGTGKTPVTIALAKAARSLGLYPGILSRGHGGASRTPRLVDPARDAASDVGDEPLLLAAHAPVAVGRDRAAGAALLKREGCDVLLMDDGFQSARIAIDLALLLVDARFGLGNARCLPAGPLRAPLAAQMGHADALLVMGEGEGAADATAAARAERIPIHHARLAPTNPEAVAGKRVLAFAGIGHPEKFFATLEEAGAVIAGRRSFPDHAPIPPDALAALAREAERRDLTLVSTAKDAARLRATGAQALDRLVVLEVEARFEPADLGVGLIRDAQARWGRRNGGG